MDSRVLSCVFQVVRDALRHDPHAVSQASTGRECIQYLSSEPGVICGVSPTLRLLDLFAFFSRYFFARPLSLALCSFSMTLLSR